MARHLAFFIGVSLLALASRALGETPPELLPKAIESWLGEKDHWAFTQRAVEWDGDTPHERLERYDPSRPGDARWQLLAIDGKPPTDAQREKWAAKKFKHHHHRYDPPLGDFFDFHEARIVAETPKLVRFSVPLRTDKNWLFPVSKVDVRVTINKETHALEHLTARVREPFKVLMGVARVTGGELDLDFLRLDDSEAGPEEAKPSGSARVSVSKLGERMDFTWSDFKRVNPDRSLGQDDNAPARARHDG